MDYDENDDQQSDTDDNFEDLKLSEEVEQLLTVVDDTEIVASAEIKDAVIDGDEKDESDEDALDYDDDEVDDPAPDVSVSQKIVFIDRIRAQDSRMPDVMSKSTLVALIIARQGVLSRGARPLVQMKNGSKDPTMIAKAEIIHGVCPRSVILDNNVEWKINDYAYFPADFINELNTIKNASVVI